MSKSLTDHFNQADIYAEKLSYEASERVRIRINNRLKNIAPKARGNKQMFFRRNGLSL